MQRIRASTSRLAPLLGVALLTAGCPAEPDGNGAAEPPADAPRTTRQAIEAAVAYLAEPENVPTHAAFYFVHFLQRRFESAALYCDQMGFEGSFEQLLATMAARGGYELTHVALAIRWLDENGCTPVSTELRESVADAMARGVRADDRLGDLEIEQAAFLHYLERGDLVPEAFVASLLRGQNPDGGWGSKWTPERRLESNWHATALALWVLLASEGRGNGAPMIPPAA